MSLTETCPKCGGQGGCPGSDFGDYGWHPCFFCGASGLVEEGTTAREEYTRKATEGLYRPEYRESEGCAYDDIGEYLRDQDNAKSLANHGCVVKDFHETDNSEECPF